MKYYTIHINDSGAIEDSDYIKINGEKALICRMYDDPEFNQLNDILHSFTGYVLNERALSIFKDCNTIPFNLYKAKVLRREKTLGFLKKNVEYDFYQIEFSDKAAEESYDWIDFEKSVIFVIKNSGEKIKIKSHQESMGFVEINKSNIGISYSFETEKIVFNKNFNLKIDLFKIPFYSWGTYVSENLKSKLENAQITDIGFADNKEHLGIMWRPHFPTIEFEK